MTSFSIIVPTYNRADLIAKTIYSLLKQNYSNFEIIIVDDGSTDNTESIISNIRDVKLKYYKIQNAERGAARNAGVQKATGDYINFFDSDDISLDDHLQTAFDTINNYKYPEVVVNGYEIVNNNKSISPRYNDINKQLLKGNLLSCNPVFVRRDIALIHSFNEDREIAGSEDYLLWLTLASKYTFYYSRKVTSKLIDHSGRSVVNFDKKKLVTRKLKMLEYVLNDDQIKNHYNKYLYRIKENTYSYISLHLAMCKIKEESVKYLLKAIKCNPLFIIKRRFFSILRLLFL